MGTAGEPHAGAVGQDALLDDGGDGGGGVDTPRQVVLISTPRMWKLEVMEGGLGVVIPPEG